MDQSQSAGGGGGMARVMWVGLPGVSSAEQENIMHFWVPGQTVTHTLPELPEMELGTYTFDRVVCVLRHASRRSVKCAWVCRWVCGGVGVWVCGGASVGRVGVCVSAVVCLVRTQVCAWEGEWVCRRVHVASATSVCP